MTDFPESGRQIYIAYDWEWQEFADFVDRRGWALFPIPTDPAAPDHAGIPTYGIMSKQAAESAEVA